MALKLFAVGCAFLTIVALNVCTGAPRPSNTALLEKSIAEFLKHDPYLTKELEHIGRMDSNDFLGRTKRQADMDGEQDIMGDVDDQSDVEKQPGFFDRAAKFVVELLQRFLKWVNSDNR